MAKHDYRKMYEELLQAIDPQPFMDKRTVEQAHENGLIEATFLREGFDRLYKDIKARSGVKMALQDARNVRKGVIAVIKRRHLKAM